jgi:hypothetical protein
MKKMLFLAIVACCTILFADAQQCQKKCTNGQSACDHAQKRKRSNNGGRLRQRNKEMMSKLSLNAAQKEKMQLLRQERKKKMDELNANTSITVKAFNDKKTALRQEMKKKREAILTNEQKEQLAKTRNDNMQARENDFNQKIARQKSNLGLNDDQVNKMKSLREKIKTDMQLVKNDNKLNDQEKKMKIKSLRAQAKEEREKIYTKEQLKKIENHRQQKEGHEIQSH